MREGQAPLSFLNLLLASFCAGIRLMWTALEGGGISSEVFMLLLCVGAVLLPLIILFRKKSSVGTVALCALLFCVLGAVRFWTVAELSREDVFYAAGKNAEITGTVHGDLSIQPSSDGRGWRFRCLVEAQTIKTDVERNKAEGRLYVAGNAIRKEDIPKIQEGDILRARGRIKRIRGYKNPGQLDMERQARSQGITAGLSAEKGAVEVIGRDASALSGYLTEVRRHYRSVLSEAMSEEDAAAIFAMLFGGYEGIRAEVLESFTATGIVHILSVSGSHITLLAAVFAWLGRALRLRRGITAVVIVSAISVYVLLASAVAPAVRSGIMGIVAALALVLERERDARQILSVTGLLMLLWSPWLLFDISFELSFAATAGLLYIAPRLRELRALENAPEWISGSLSITIAAQAAVLPLLAWYFHVVSLSSLLANILVVPVLELIMIAALFAGMAAVFLPMAARFILAGDSLLFGGASELSKLLAELPMSQVYLPPMGAGFAILYYSVIVFWLQDRERKEYLVNIIRGTRGRAAALAVFAGIFFVGLSSLFRAPEMSVHFIDVGQGDSALIITPHGRAFMMDTGGTRDAGFDIGTRVDVPYLLQHGVRALDAVFLTHAHEDHSAGTGGILRKLPAGTVFAAHEGKEVYQAAMRLSSRDMAKTVFTAPPEGTEIIIDGVKIEVLFAPEAAGSRTSENELSNVYRVTYGNASFLFTGDLVKEKEKELIRKHNVRSSVLKVGHHGSKTSSSEPFLSAVQPKWAVISVGDGNSFGHPNRETLQALENHGIKVYRTDQNGAVTFRTDGDVMRVDSWIRPSEGY